MLGGACAARVLQASRSRTNAVFILTDDQGVWARNSPQCPDIYTPNLSRLAREGASFTDAFACTPVCSPSRATYLTGRLPCHHGIQDFLMPETRSLLEGQLTYSQVLADSGYTLGLCGKWHMGKDETRQAGFS